MTPSTLRLGRGTSTFLGFGPGAAHRFGRTVDVRLGQPASTLTELSDCLLVPGLTALYDLGGRRLDLTAQLVLGSWSWDLRRRERRQSPPRIVPPPEAQVIDEPVLFLGSLSKHYGHFLTDSLARAWALDLDLGRPQPVFAPLAAGPRWPGFAQQILGALGAPSERAFFSRSALHLRRVIVPEPRMLWDRQVSQGFDAPHRAAAAVIAPAPPRTFAGQRVYLSRAGLAGRQRRILEEEALEQRLRREGFVVLRPETLALAEQIGLFEHAAAVVGPVGSAFHTVLFRRAPEPLRMACLTWGEVQGRFLLVDAVKPVDTTYIRALSFTTPAPRRWLRALGPDGGHVNDETFRLDLETAMDGLSTAGFL